MIIVVILLMVCLFYNLYIWFSNGNIRPAGYLRFIAAEQENPCNYCASDFLGFSSRAGEPLQLLCINYA